MVGSVESERARIAADLHDGPVQELTALAYSTEMARRYLSRTDLARCDESLERLGSGIQATVKNLRQLMLELRPPLLDERGLEFALREDLLTTLERRVGLVCSLEAQVTRRLSPSVEIVLYRIAQEALTNAAKHAQAKHVTVSLTSDSRTVSLAVRDDGIGFEPAETAQVGSFGLAGMRARATTAGGTLTVRSKPGQGTTVAVMLPMVHTQEP
jgi:signal transduction histidine kinase